ncbi:MAG: ABC transporter ATP-binding protein [Spirochaetes bacterium]|nr:ABC transporter ATP-binding protein [Spirochaetota bacterium]
MPAMFVIETAALVRRFGRIAALDRFDLAVRRGETLGLLGPNGSGKTTFIRIAAGLMRPTSGHIEVLGQGLPAGRAAVIPRIGYMPQAHGLYEDLTVRENLGFFSRIFGERSGARRKARVDEALALVGLTERGRSLTRTLSGGMRQRLSLACALVHDPELLLLDEPTVGVDPELRRSFWEHFRALNRKGVTIVISSHVMDEADRCDRLALIRQGRVLAVGNVPQIRERAGTADLESAFLALAGNAAGTPA